MEKNIGGRPSLGSQLTNQRAKDQWALLTNGQRDCLMKALERVQRYGITVELQALVLLWDHQDGTCALTGHAFTPYGINVPHLFRIDPDEGYVEGNTILITRGAKELRAGIKHFGAEGLARFRRWFVEGYEFVMAEVDPEDPRGKLGKAPEDLLDHDPEQPPSFFNIPGGGHA